MATRVILTVGTKRGLFLLESTKGRGRWKVTGPLLKGWSINTATIDTRSAPAVHVGAGHFARAGSARARPDPARRYR